MTSGQRTFQSRHTAESTTLEKQREAFALAKVEARKLTFAFEAGISGVEMGSLGDCPDILDPQANEIFLIVGCWTGNWNKELLLGSRDHLHLPGTTRLVKETNSTFFFKTSQTAHSLENHKKLRPRFAFPPTT